MRIRLDATSRVPPYEQLRAQISLQVAAGQLRPGARLPTIRALGDELSLANGTIARAYRELEHAGIVVMRGRAGTFVTEAPPVAFAIAERRERLDTAAQAFVNEARQLGVSAAEAVEAVSAVLQTQPPTEP